MTDDFKEIQHRLEQATAPQSPGDDVLEPETAALRAGWLALGELLEAAQSPTNPAPKNRSERFPAASEATTLAAPIQRVPRRRLAIVATVAASALVVVTVAWYAAKTRSSTTHSPSPQIASASRTTNSRLTQPTSPLAAKQTLPHVAIQPSTASSTSETTWNDSLDDDIESTGWSILQAQQTQLASAALVGSVQYQMETLRADLETSSL